MVPDSLPDGHGLTQQNDGLDAAKGWTLLGGWRPGAQWSRRCCDDQLNSPSPRRFATAKDSSRSVRCPRSATALTRAGRDGQRLLQGRADLRALPPRPLENRQRRRTGHPWAGSTGTTDRLHGYLGDISPAEFEGTFYDAQRNDQPLVEIQ